MKIKSLSISDCDVSIIIPVYNVEQFIARCARSLFDQTFSEVEYIFVNDCSPDRSVEVLNEVISEYPHLRGQITIINHEVNKGVAEARNTGLDYAKGEYVLQVDSDDWVEKTMIEELYLLAKDSNADLVWTDFFIDYPNNSNPQVYSNQHQSEVPDGCINAILSGTMHGASWNKLIKRELVNVNKLKFPSGVSICEDMVFVISCLLKCSNIVYLPKAFYHYYQFQGSVTMVATRTSFENQFVAIKQIERIVPLDKFEYSLNLYKARVKSAVFVSGFFTNKEFEACFPESTPYVIACTSGRINKLVLRLATKRFFFLARILLYIGSPK